MKLPARLHKPGWKVIGFLLLVALIMTAAHATSGFVGGLAFFKVRNVEMRGIRYADADSLASRLRIDTLQSIWQDLDIPRRRLAGHPLVGSVDVSRRLPGTLVVTIRERTPVALVALAQGLQPFDSAGRALPIDPVGRDLDLPIVNSADPKLLAMLGQIRGASMPLYLRVSEASREAAGDMSLTLDHFLVRIPPGVSADRLADIFPVEFDLARRQQRIAELDLRYRDQVIARLQ